MSVVKDTQPARIGPAGHFASVEGITVSPDGWLVATDSVDDHVRV